MKCHLCGNLTVLNNDSRYTTPSTLNYICKKCNDFYSSEGLYYYVHSITVNIITNNITHYILYYKKRDVYICSYDNVGNAIQKSSYIGYPNIDQDKPYISDITLDNVFFPLNENDDINEHLEKVYQKIMKLAVFK